MCGNQHGAHRLVSIVPTTGTIRREWGETVLREGKRRKGGCERAVRDIKEEGAANYSMVRNFPCLRDLLSDGKNLTFRKKYQALGAGERKPIRDEGGEGGENIGDQKERSVSRLRLLHRRRVIA